MIDSKIAQRFAKADADKQAADEALRAVLSDTNEPSVYLQRLRGPEEEAARKAAAEWSEAAGAMAAEIRAGGHHLAEDY
ncbi:MAG: hypothetical protein CME80_08385 [Halomonas sp.]|nr:hypothetical protein [Halomonas sp.]